MTPYDGVIAYTVLVSIYAFNREYKTHRLLDDLTGYLPLSSCKILLLSSKPSIVSSVMCTTYVHTSDGRSAVARSIRLRPPAFRSFKLPSSGRSALS